MDGGQHEQPDGPLDAVDLGQLLVAQLKPGARADPPAAHVVGVELVGVGQHPARQLVGLLARDAERSRQCVALIGTVRVDRRVLQRDRQPRVRAAQRLVEAGRRDGDRVPVQAGVPVRLGLSGDHLADRGEREAPGAELCQPVAAQDRLGVLVAA